MLKSPSSASRSWEAIFIMSFDCVPRSEELPVRDKSPPTVTVTSGLSELANSAGAKRDSRPGAKALREVRVEDDFMRRT